MVARETDWKRRFRVPLNYQKLTSWSLLHLWLVPLTSATRPREVAVAVRRAEVRRDGRAGGTRPSTA